MTATTIRVQMAQRKDTAANWTAANPILLSGEIGYETDTKKFKIGDGTTNWNSLAYLPIPDGSGNLTITGNLEIGSTGSLTFEGSTADGFETTLAVTNPTADRTITLPNQSGTVLVSGNASIVDADIAANAEIAVSKLADGTARQLLQTDAAGTGVEWTSNIDVPGTLDVTSTATFDSIAQYPLGSAGAPTITFTGDNNTGIYSPGSDQLTLATGGTGRLFVDASGRVGVGASTPQHLLDCTSIGRFTGNTNSAASGAGIEIGYDSGNTTGFIQSYNRGSSTYLSTAVDGSDVRLKTSSIERCRIDSSGRLLVGTSTATNNLRLNETLGIVSAGSGNLGGLSVTTYAGTGGDAGSVIDLQRSRGTTDGSLTKVVADDRLGVIVFRGSDGAAFSDAALIEARADGEWNTAGDTTDSPGRLVFSTTADGESSPRERLRITSSGFTQFVAPNGSLTGGIGTTADTYIHIGTGDTGLLYQNNVDAIEPWNVSTNGARDGIIDLGLSSNRFNDVYATNGTIQTSDEHEKQQITPLTSAELIAANAISKLFVTFKWNTSVDEKGEGARIHTGVIAQQVEAAMSNAGLDAKDYGFFISTTWWEVQTDIVSSEDQNTYAQVRHYYSPEEAPADAVQRTRKGIRYPELLSFVNAAMEQRLTNIELRLAALESA